MSEVVARSGFEIQIPEYQAQKKQAFLRPGEMSFFTFSSRPIALRKLHNPAHYRKEMQGTAINKDSQFLSNALKCTQTPSV
jgi:hypothetical protein